MRINRGFTLIEVMVVMAIIGAVIATVSFVIPDRRGSAQTEFAIGIQQRLAYASQYAMVRSEIVGAYFDEQGMRFVGWNSEQRFWQELDERGLRPVSWPETVRYELTSENLALLAQEDLEPDQLFYSRPQPEKGTDPVEEPFEQMPQLMFIGDAELPTFALRLNAYTDPQLPEWVVFSDDGFSVEIIDAASFDADGEQR